jgi:hypothetical protein
MELDSFLRQLLFEIHDRLFVTAIFKNKDKNEISIQPLDYNHNSLNYYTATLFITPSILESMKFVTIFIYKRYATIPFTYEQLIDLEMDDINAKITRIVDSLKDFFRNRNSIDTVIIVSNYFCFTLIFQGKKRNRIRNQLQKSCYFSNTSNRRCTQLNSQLQYMLYSGQKYTTLYDYLPNYSKKK